jgi:hypothetical protein
VTAGLIDLRDWCLHRDIERLLRGQGPRVISEMLIELTGTCLCRTELDRIVARYTAAFGSGVPGFFRPEPSNRRPPWQS